MADETIDLRDGPVFDVLGFVENRPEWLLSLYAEPAVAEQRNRRDVITQIGRPAAIRLCGPLGGARMVTDPAQLRREARRLAIAADLLEREQAATGDVVLPIEAPT